jgi:hypothetical protein
VRKHFIFHIDSLFSTRFISFLHPKSTFPLQWMSLKIHMQAIALKHQQAIHIVTRVPRPLKEFPNYCPKTSAGHSHTQLYTNLACRRAKMSEPWVGADLTLAKSLTCTFVNRENLHSCRTRHSGCYPVLYTANTSLMRSCLYEEEEHSHGLIQCSYCDCTQHEMATSSKQYTILQQCLHHFKADEILFYNQ